MTYFPVTRLRRTRHNDKFRGLVRETTLRIDQLVYPFFIHEGITKPQKIDAMPGIMQWPIKQIGEQAKRVANLGIPAVLLFGIPNKKDPVGSEAYNKNGVVQEAIREIKSKAPEIIIITDICLCEYTDHGHCGVVKNNTINNDPSLELLSRMALSHVEAGADMVAPSDMMDGRIGAIRKILDKNHFSEIPIMAYSAKYASSFYGPFREAAGSAPQFGDRKTYQMDPANAKEALREIELDIQEGADIIMVKPALSYLDVVYRVSQRFDLPLAVYNVSGEYAMVKAAAQNGWIDEKKIVLEMLIAMKRAGADIIITYFAPQVAEWLNAK